MWDNEVRIIGFRLSYSVLLNLATAVYSEQNILGYW